MNQHQVAIYSTERAKLLFGCYRRGDANDPDQYVAAIAAVLSTFDGELIREATDPRTGIQTSEQFAAFMPNPGELKRYCDAEAARRHRLAEMAKLPSPAPMARRLAAPRLQEPGCLANIFVPMDHGRYQRLAQWAERPDTDPRLFRFGVSSDRRSGIWVGLTVWEGNSEAAQRTAHTGADRTDQGILADWAKAGLDPVFNSNGTPMSVQLARMLNRMPQVKSEAV